MQTHTQRSFDLRATEIGTTHQQPWIIPLTLFLALLLHLFRALLLKIHDFAVVVVRSFARSSLPVISMFCSSLSLFVDYLLFRSLGLYVCKSIYTNTYLFLLLAAAVTVAACRQSTFFVFVDVAACYCCCWCCYSSEQPTQSKTNIKIM